MDIRKKQRAVVDALEDIKGRDIVVYNTERLSPHFERVIMATGDSTRQVKALADNVQEQLKKLGARVHGTEGGDTGEWVLVDLGDIVVHVMHPTTRLTYNLEELWGGKDVKIKREPEPTARIAPKPKAAAKAKAKAKPKAKPKPKAKAKAKAPASKAAARPRKAPAKKKKPAKRRA
jgi:ribosome-associated protein